MPLPHLLRRRAPRSGARRTARRLAVTVPLVSLAGVLALTGCANRERDAAPGAGTSTTASSAAQTAAFPVQVTVPGTDHAVTVERRPERIVSLAPSSTESLFAIGAGEQVVAVDNQSNYPEQAPRTDLSGYTPNIEAITGYNPDLVIASNDTEQLVASLEKVKVPVLLLPSPHNLDELYAEVTALGKATGHLTEAEDLVRTMRSDIDKIVKDTPKPAKQLTYYHELDPQLYSATSRTFIGQIYGLFGLVNVADAAGGTGDYPQLSPEHVINANPDLVFLADTKCCGQDAAAVAARPGWQSVTAVRDNGVVALNDDIASRWGPRVVDLVRTVSDAVTRTAQQG
ncbi:iron complex transport system substrate-binding protein [Goodfellowiella coeruleoviolacea]|uniref:Iron complex transport system substrate-binding protein n=1 Tax=Goodfellowiella coeruleoviolacea TaxID=334858 RepID=A0AAE3GFG0_9PSEU|nr:iron complex transport system substrate-binding protein [Goodfellowiella coeruleoviolacea]